MTCRDFIWKRLLATAAVAIGVLPKRYTHHGTVNGTFKKWQLGYMLPSPYVRGHINPAPGTVFRNCIFQENRVTFADRIRSVGFENCKFELDLVDTLFKGCYSG